MVEKKLIEAKIVPNSQPNAEGEWREFTVPFRLRYSFGEVAAMIEDQLNGEEHMVAYNTRLRFLTQQ